MEKITSTNDINNLNDNIIIGDIKNFNIINSTIVFTGKNNIIYIDTTIRERERGMFASSIHPLISEETMLSVFLEAALETYI